MSYILAEIDTSYITLLGRNNNFRSILSRFGDITAFMLWTPTFPYPTLIPPEIWGCSPWTILIVLCLGVAESEYPSLTMCIVIYKLKLTQTVTTIPQRHSHRRRDLWTDDLPWQYRILCVSSCGKNRMSFVKCVRLDVRFSRINERSVCDFVYMP